MPPGDGARRPAPYRQLTIRPSDVKPSYDVIVIGAGIGGLTCAAYLARLGARVLVVERHSVPGGLCSSFVRRRCRFDSGAHYFGGLGDPKSFGGMLLRPLQLDLSFIRVDPVDLLHFPDRTLKLPAGLDDHIDLLKAMFRDEAEEIGLFFREMLRIYRHFYRGRQQSDVLHQYERRTYQELLDSRFRDTRLKAILAATVGYIGARPDRVSSIAMASMMMSYFYDGGYQVQGGSQALADSLLRRIAADGGSVLLNTPVDRFVVSRGRIEGVVIRGGHLVRSTTLVSNADARQTFFRLVGTDSIEKAYARRLETSRLSPSCFVLYLAVRCESELLEGVRGWYWDSYRLNASSAVPFYVATPTLVDPSLCPSGYHVVTATTVYPERLEGDPAAWADYKRKCEEATLARLDRIVPGLTSRIAVQESATARTIERYTANAEGVMYGWDATPDRFWTNRLPIETPFENLFLCGHWTSAGSGVIAVVASGFAVARSVLGRLSQCSSTPVMPTHSSSADAIGTRIES